MEIRRRVDSRVAAALGRDSPDWRMRNVCAPCLYTLDDEPELSPAMLVSMDGNQSLKLVDDLFRSQAGEERYFPLALDQIVAINSRCLMRRSALRKCIIQA